MAKERDTDRQSEREPSIQLEVRKEMRDHGTLFLLGQDFQTEWLVKRLTLASSPSHPNLGVFMIRGREPPLMEHLPCTWHRPRSHVAKTLFHQWAASADL